MGGKHDVTLIHYNTVTSYRTSDKHGFFLEAFAHKRDKNFKISYYRSVKKANFEGKYMNNLEFSSFVQKLIDSMIPIIIDTYTKGSQKFKFSHHTTSFRKTMNNILA